MYIFKCIAWMYLVFSVLSIAGCGLKACSATSKASRAAKATKATTIIRKVKIADDVISDAKVTSKLEPLNIRKGIQKTTGDVASTYNNILAADAATSEYRRNRKDTAQIYYLCLMMSQELEVKEDSIFFSTSIETFKGDFSQKEISSFIRLSDNHMQFLQERGDSEILVKYKEYCYSQTAYKS